MRRITVIAATVVVTAAAMAAGVAALFTVRSTSDGLLLLYPAQAKECAEGGGCAVFSEREFQQALLMTLQGLQKGRQRQGGTRRGDV